MSNGDTESPETDNPESSDSGESGGYEPAFKINNQSKDTGGTEVSKKTEDTEDSDSAELPEGDFGGSNDTIEADGKTVESVSVPEVDPETLQPALRATFKVLGTRRGDYWELSEKEAETLSEAYAPVVNKYAPHMASEYGPETMALMTTAVVISPRLSQDFETGKFQDPENEGETLAETRGYDGEEPEEPEPEEPTNQEPEESRVSAFSKL